MASVQEPVLRIIEGIQKLSLLSTIPFSVLMIGIEKLMETEFPCLCEPVLNQLLAAFMFIAPALLAFIIMLFLVRPCKHCSCSCRKCCAKAFLPCLIPPVAWVIMLLLDGQYVACGLMFEQGNYVSDKDDPPVKWCQSNSSDETEEKQWHQQIVGLSQFPELVTILHCRILYSDRMCLSYLPFIDATPSSSSDQKSQKACRLKRHLLPLL
ncbi:hypothetical protein MHYP_G00302220 [Metynnis hypsauchen]